MHPVNGAAVPVSDIAAGLGAAANGDYAIGGSFRRGEYTLTDTVRLGDRSVIKPAGNLVAVLTSELPVLLGVRTWAVQLLSWHTWLVERLSGAEIAVVAGCQCTMCTATAAGLCNVCNSSRGECPAALCHANVCVCVAMSTTKRRNEHE